MMSSTSAETARPRMAPFLAKPEPKKFETRTAIVSYLLALLLGLYAAHYLLPTAMIFARDIRVRPPYQEDAAMNVYGQRYFTKDAWRWPPLLAKNLGAPQGTNVGFTDGVPLIELVVKLFRRFLPPDFHSVYLWLALCWVFQSMAAVFALRSTGERRLLPNLAVAVIAVSMPTLLVRVPHSALCSHFLLLIALGLYLRITRNATAGNLVAAGALMLAALLVNPYIMEMVIAVLVAAPISLLIRRDSSWMRVATGIGGAIALTAVVALLLGYGRAVPMGGFGTYSMNLLSPVLPGEVIDATGGQYEGYQYLGAGVILLLLVADFCLSMPERLSLLRRHAGLVFSCVVLTLLALSNKIYAGHRLLLDLPAPSWFEQIRGSGRFFWVVAYVLLIAGAVILCRRLSARWAIVLLLVFAALQYSESMGVRRYDRYLIRTRPGYTIDTALFRGLLANHSRLIVWPKFGCGADVAQPEFSDLYLLASEVAIPVNMSYIGRFTKWPDCALPEFPISVAPGELWVFVPKWTPAMVLSVVDWRSICRQSGVLVACAQDLRGRNDLPVPNLPELPLNTKLSAAANAPGSQWLAFGWHGGEAWGAWSRGAKAYIVANLHAPPKQGLVLKVWASGIAFPPAATQKVTVVANGQPLAAWDVKGEVGEYGVTLPPSVSRDLVIAFDVDHPVIPRQQGLGADPRELGFALNAFQLDAR